MFSSHMSVRAVLVSLPHGFGYVVCVSRLILFLGVGKCVSCVGVYTLAAAARAAAAAYSSYI